MGSCSPRDSCDCNHAPWWLRTQSSLSTLPLWISLLVSLGRVFFMLSAALIKLTS